MNNQDREGIEKLEESCMVHFDHSLEDILKYSQMKLNGTTYRLAIVKEPGGLPVNPYKSLELLEEVDKRAYWEEDAFDCLVKAFGSDRARDIWSGFAQRARKQGYTHAENDYRDIGFVQEVKL